MESSHSPKPRRHWNRCSTKPLQNTSLSSDRMDLRNTSNRDGVLLFQRESGIFLLMHCKYSLRYSNSGEGSNYNKKRKENLEL